MAFTADSGFDNKTKNNKYEISPSLRKTDFHDRLDLEPNPRPAKILRFATELIPAVTSVTALLSPVSRLLSAGVPRSPNNNVFRSGAL